ncbi:MAG: hypothetical protein AAF380_01065 [Bacteroidota bacterium]
MFTTVIELLVEYVNDLAEELVEKVNTPKIKKRRAEKEKAKNRHKAC